MFRRLIALSIGLMISPELMTAQVLGEEDVVDRVMAIVGDSIILQTEIQEELQRMAMSDGVTLPDPGPELDQMMSQVLEQMINQTLVLQEAARDTLLQIDESEIEDRVASRIDEVTQQFGGQSALQQALETDGLNLAEYRDLLRTQIRQEQTQQLFLQRSLQNASTIELSEDDLLESFQASRGQLQQRPKIITFTQVVLKPTPSEMAEQAARAEADSVLGEIRSGGDFEELAQLHSDDIGSSELGGDLGWFRRGAMVAEFDDAAFSMMDGQVSDIVQTEFGYHIIKIERSRGGEKRGRHILVMPEMTETDVQTARDTASVVLEQVKNGEPMEILFAQYSDQEAPDTIPVPFDQIDQLPLGYGVISTAMANDVIGPIEYQTPRGDVRLAVVKVEEIREAGAYTFEDLRGQVAAQLQEQRQYARILEELRAKTHIEIRQ
ncbi:MAG: peptidylprolyl isomerase [Longimicrobiales bacterium]|nr:peptidylprolyl isomerase [Longimicrobiales bacterium]